MGLHVSNGYLTVILVLICQHVITTEAIKCYQCIFAPYVYFTNNSLLCKDFDYSQKYIVDCPYSTLCMKKNSNIMLNGVQINGTERDCASQKLDTQRILDGKWKAEIRVEEPYTEGCKRDDNKFYKTPYVEHCYCRGDLCNPGNTVHGKNTIRILAFGVFSVFVTTKAVANMFL